MEHGEEASAGKDEDAKVGRGQAATKTGRTSDRFHFGRQIDGRNACQEIGLNRLMRGVLRADSAETEWMLRIVGSISESKLEPDISYRETLNDSSWSGSNVDLAERSISRPQDSRACEESCDQKYRLLGLFGLF